MRWTLIIMLGCCISAHGQIQKTDSLKRRLGLPIADTDKIKTLIWLGRQYSYSNPDSALWYFKMSGSLSENLHYIYGEFYSLIYSGEVLATIGNYSKAQDKELEALHKASDPQNEDLIADANMHLGNLFFYQGNFHHALDYYLRTKQVDKNDTSFEEAITGLKGRTFLELNQLDSAYTNSRIAYNIESRRRPLTWILPAVTLASILSRQGKTDSALNIYKKYKDFQPGSKSNLELSIPMAEILFEKKQTDSAIRCLKKTLNYARNRRYLEEGIAASKLLADIYKTQANLDSAYTYLAINSALRDSLSNLNKDREILNEEFDKKLYNEEIQSGRLKLQNRVKIYGFGISLVILFVLTFLLWRNNKHKKREFFLLQKQKHDEKQNLQSEFQQTLLKTQLEIQEQTLKNISQEIHDNIGQILSLAKLNLSTVNHIHPEREKIDDSKKLIATAILDLRDLAKSLNTDHVNMMGLAKSTEQELESIKKTGYFETIFEISGEVYKLESQKELILFRIVQEVFNNIIKHAKAGRIVVKMCYEPDHFSLKISDDGNGFDVNSLKSKGSDSHGLGIKNMWDRAQMIGAQLAIISAAGQGTTVDIRLPVSS